MIRLWFRNALAYTNALPVKTVFMAAFLFCALPVTVTTALIMPPGQAPDETSHLVRAAGLLHGAVMGVREPRFDQVMQPNAKVWASGVKADTGLVTVSAFSVVDMNGRLVETMQKFKILQSYAGDHALFYEYIPNTVQYFPIAYLPATLGLAAGLAVGATPFTCILLARLCMAAAFLALGLVTLRIAAYGEALLLTVLLLPMTVFLAGSLNQDGLLIATACLACAALTRGWRIFGLVALTCMLGSKPPYLLLLGAFLLPFSAPGFWRRARAVALAVMPVLVWVALVSALVMVPLGTPPYHPGPLYTGDRSVLLDHADPGGNLHILLSKPSRFLTMAWDMWGDQGGWIWREAIGVLGSLQIFLSDSVYIGWSVAIAVAMLGLLVQVRPTRLGAADATLNAVTILAIIAVTVWAISVGMYLSWDNLGAPEFGGVQGRYLLPLLPFMLFVVPQIRAIPRLPVLLPALPAFALGLYDIGDIPVQLVRAFYLQ
jgi:hypothetical protein